MQYGATLLLATFALLTFANDSPLHPKGFEKYLQSKALKHTIRASGIRQLIKEGRLDSEFASQFFKPKKSRFARGVKKKGLNQEIEEVKIVPIKSDGADTIHCYKLPNRFISCKQKDLRYDIKLKDSKELSNESLTALVRALINRLNETVESTWEKRRRKRLDFIPVTLHPAVNGPPLMIVLPPSTCAEPWIHPKHTTNWPYKSCKQCIASTRRSCVLTHDTQVMSIECCPADLEPLDPNKEPNSNDYYFDTSTDQLKQEAYIYSCRWQGKREVGEDVFLVPIQPPDIKISFDAAQVSNNKTPSKK